MQKLMEQIKQIILKPRETWKTISEEETTVSTLLKEYLFILAAIPSIASFLGYWIIGIYIPFVGRYHFSFGESLLIAILNYVLIIASVWIISKVIKLLAPKFSSVQDDVSGFKLAAYSYTPLLVAGILYLIPRLGILVLFGGIYGLYLLYLGLPIVMQTPKEKTLAYTVTIIITMILIYTIHVSIIQGFINIFGPSLPKI
jgi:hypothetical protein